MIDSPAVLAPTATPAPTGEADRPQDYVADISFDAMGLSPELRRAIVDRGYATPTPVQARAFGPVTAGRDLIVRSKTGTGKTAAFGMPIIDRIPMGTRTVKALIMCPTRELAIQVAAELAELAKYRDIRVTAIYGGASMKVQEDALDAGSAIIVGTPGRVYDHIRRGNLKLDTAAHAVLDEADEMLNQGFYEEVTRILDCLPKGRQVLLFSATVPEDIQRLIAKYTTNAETLLLSGDVFTVEHIHHVRYDVSDAYPKPRNLLYLLEMEEPDNAIVFCNTRSDTELVTAVLNRNGFDAELLNGDLPQSQRERVMGKIKRGEVAYMVATDIAARGIDISDLGHVINYSLPEDPAVYLHRVGRTGRIGKKGVALNLVTGKELMTLTALERKYSVKFETRTMPTAESATKLWTERHVKALLEGSQGSIYEGYLGLAGEIKKRPDADALIAFMMREFFVHKRMDKARSGAPESETEAAAETAPPPPPREERSSRGGRDRDRGPRREGRDGPRRDERPRREDRPREDRPRRESTAETQTAVAAVAPAPSVHEAITAPGGIAAVPTPPPSTDLLIQAPAPLAPVSHDTSLAPREERPRREDRPRREPRERRDFDDAPAAHHAGPRLSDKELFAKMQQQNAPAVQSSNVTMVSSPGNPAQAPVAPPAAPKKMSDRERFDALMAGKPLPPIAEAPAREETHAPARTASYEADAAPAAAPALGGNEVRATRPRREGEREGRGHGRDRDGRRDRGDRGERHERPRRAESTGGTHIEEVAATRSKEGDQALLAALKNGQPLPDLGDPTVADAGGEAAGEGRGRSRRGRDRKAPELPPIEPGDARLWLNLGRADGMDASMLPGALEAAGAPSGKVKHADIRGTFSYVVVADADAGSFEALQGKNHGEKPIKIERARR